MKKCHKCGSELPEEALFCKKCGSQLNKISTNNNNSVSRRTTVVKVQNNTK